MAYGLWGNITVCKYRRSDNNNNKFQVSVPVSLQMWTVPKPILYITVAFLSEILLQANIYYEHKLKLNIQGLIDVCGCFRVEKDLLSFH